MQELSDKPEEELGLRECKSLHNRLVEHSRHLAKLRKEAEEAKRCPLHPFSFLSPPLMTRLAHLAVKREGTSQCMSTARAT